jgi:hypothetical protein
MISVQERGEINIKELTLTEPRGGIFLPFHPERDITPDQWKVTQIYSKKCLERLSELSVEDANDFKHRFLSDYIRGVALVAPDRVQSLMDDQSWGALMNQMNKWDKRSGMGIVAFLNKATMMKLLSPERFAEKSAVSVSQWAYIANKFNEYYQMGGLIRDGISVAAEISILKPELLQDLDLSDAKNYAENRIEYFSEILDDDPEKLKALASSVVEYKVFDPKRVKQLPLSQETWGKIMNKRKTLLMELMEFDLKSYKEGSFTPSAGNILGEVAVLAAENIIVTEKGVNLVFPNLDTFSKDNMSMPERRRF